MDFKCGDIVYIQGVPSNNNYSGNYIYNDRKGTITRVYDGGAWVKFGPLAFETEAFANKYIIPENKYVKE